MELPSLVRRAVAVLAMTLGCGTDSNAPQDAAVSNEASVDATPDGTTDGSRSLSEGSIDALIPPDVLTEPAPSCALGERRCVGATLEICETNTEGQESWRSLPCGTGARCENATCVSGCSDACLLGETRVGEECVLVQTNGDRATLSTTSLHDRAREYVAYLHKWAMPVGRVDNVRFTDGTRTVRERYDDGGGTGDSALWTGMYLAAEAMRYVATGSPESKTRVQALVRTLHDNWRVSGDPGFLARFAAPANSPPEIRSLFNEADRAHHRSTYKGEDWLWIGHPSRDSYVGPVLGYALAYDALADDSESRALIRDDMITFVNQLLETREVCPVIDDVPCSDPIAQKYGVYTDDEPLVIRAYTDGRRGTLTGAQEWSPLVLGVIPRFDVNMQLLAIFTVAQRVTRDAPGAEVAHARFTEHLRTEASKWILYAGAGYGGLPRCGVGYNVYNLGLTPFYVYSLRATQNTNAVSARMLFQMKPWSHVRDHKNSYFSFIAGSTITGEEARVQVGMDQLAGFDPPPRFHRAVNNPGPADPMCPNNAVTAIDVRDRRVEDFIWQRHPFWMVDRAEPELVYPGVDFLLAYWMGRYHGFIQDDHAGTCTAWRPTSR